MSGSDAILLDWVSAARQLAAYRRSIGDRLRLGELLTLAGWSVLADHYVWTGRQVKVVWSGGTSLAVQPELMAALSDPAHPVSMRPPLVGPGYDGASLLDAVPSRLAQPGGPAVRDLAPYIGPTSADFGAILADLWMSTPLIDMHKHGRALADLAGMGWVILPRGEASPDPKWVQAAQDMAPVSRAYLRQAFSEAVQAADRARAASDRWAVAQTLAEIAAAPITLAGDVVDAAGGLLRNRWILWAGLGVGALLLFGPRLLAARQLLRGGK